MSALIEFDEVCKYYQMGDTLVRPPTTSLSKSTKASSWPSSASPVLVNLLV